MPEHLNQLSISAPGIFCYPKYAVYPPFRIRNDGRFNRLAMDVNPPELRYLVCWMRSPAQEKSDNAPKLKLHPCWLVDCAELLTSSELLRVSVRAKFLGLFYSSSRAMVES